MRSGSSDAHDLVASKNQNFHQLAQESSGELPDTPHRRTPTFNASRALVLPFMASKQLPVASRDGHAGAVGHSVGGFVCNTRLCSKLLLPFSPFCLALQFYLILGE